VEGSGGIITGTASASTRTDCIKVGKDSEKVNLLNGYLVEI